MTSVYDRTAERAAKTIAKKGATVTFLAGPWSPAMTADVPGSAIQIEDDPDALARLGVLSNPITLLIAAKSLPAGFRPQASMRFTWASTDPYAVRSAEALAPDGTPILWTVVGSA